MKKKILELGEEKFINKLNSLFNINKFKINIDVSFTYKDSLRSPVLNAYNDYGYITVNLYRNFYNFISEYGYKRFVDEILNIIEHEKIHDIQYKGINPIHKKSINPYVDRKKYYKNPQEMMVYSKQIVNELLRKNSKESIMDSLRYYPGNLQYKSDMYRYYYENYYEDKKVWKRFIKYMYQYLEN